LARFSVFVRAGYAMVGTSYRHAGWGAHMAVADTENARRIFVDHIGKPRITIEHGQSWGGNVAAKLNETLAATPDGKRIYDGALITSGVLGGGTQGYDYRADLPPFINIIATTIRAQTSRSIRYGWDCQRIPR